MKSKRVSWPEHCRRRLIGAILEANQRRGLHRRHDAQKLIVAGCMAQRFASELRTSMPEVDAGRIGVEVSDGFQLHPEQTTDALVCHHPQAKYFVA